jgi:hypothetical protein
MTIHVGFVLGRNARSLLGLGFAALLLVACGRSGLLDYEYGDAGVPEVDGGSTDGEEYDGTVFDSGAEAPNLFPEAAPGPDAPSDGGRCNNQTCQLGPQVVTYRTARDRRWARGSQGSASPWDRLWASYPP